MSIPIQQAEPAIIRLVISFTRYPDSHKPKNICAAAVLWALVWLREQPGHPCRSANRAELLNALVQAVTTKHSKDQLNKWNEWASFCACDRNNRWLGAIPEHCPERGSVSPRPEWETPNRPLNQVILAMYDFLDPIIRDISPTHFTDKRVKKQLWPRKPEDLVPNGSQGTILGLSQWFQYTSSTLPLNFLLTIFPLIQPITRQTIRNLHFMLPLVLTFNIFAKKFSTFDQNDPSAPTILVQAWHYGLFFKYLLEYGNPTVAAVFPEDVAKEMFQDCGDVLNRLSVLADPSFAKGTLPVDLYIRVREGFAKRMREEDLPEDMRSRPLMELDRNTLM